MDLTGLHRQIDAIVGDYGRIALRDIFKRKARSHFFSLCWPHKVQGGQIFQAFATTWVVAKAWKIRSEEHTSELQSLMSLSFAVFCLTNTQRTNRRTY